MPIGAPLIGHIERITLVGFGTIDGRPAVVSGSRDGILRLWDARTGEPIGAPLEPHTAGITSVAFGAIDGQLIVSGIYGKTIWLRDARTGRLIGPPFYPPLKGFGPDCDWPPN